MCFDLGRLPLISILWLVSGSLCFGQIFGLPTPNRALFEPGGEARFFVGTVGKPWASGTFGCVRSDGWQIHEGLDIRSVHRNKTGESVDPILATASGTVAYINHKSSLSNYGKYLILKHQIEGLEIFSVYAHLSAISKQVQVGHTVKQGEIIATMGRTTNTRQGISKDRAHLHFELNLFVNDDFPIWYKKRLPGQRNDHGAWNGRNLLGLDPRAILLEQNRQGSAFSLLKHVRSQPELCRILIRSKNFSYAKRYISLIKRNPLTEREGIGAYEIAINFNGLPFELIPRAPSELVGRAGKISVLSVNQVELDRNPCRKLLQRRGKHWELSSTGQQLIDLLVY